MLFTEFISCFTFFYSFFNELLANFIKLKFRLTMTHKLIILKNESIKAQREKNRLRFVFSLFLFSRRRNTEADISIQWWECQKTYDEMKNEMTLLKLSNFHFLIFFFFVSKIDDLNGFKCGWWPNSNNNNNLILRIYNS